MPLSQILAGLKQSQVNVRIDPEDLHQMKVQALMVRIQLSEFVQKLFRRYMTTKRWPEPTMKDG
jgi:CHAD domain-containing protein